MQTKYNKIRTVNFEDDIHCMPQDDWEEHEPDANCWCHPKIDEKNLQDVYQGMSYFELPVRVECPHCGEEMNECAEFNMGMADNCGVNSGLYEAYCNECGKDFWFKAYCTFETEASSVWKKKPKEKNKIMNPRGPE